MVHAYLYIRDIAHIHIGINKIHYDNVALDPIKRVKTTAIETERTRVLGRNNALFETRFSYIILSGSCMCMI